MWQIIFTFIFGAGLCGWGMYGYLQDNEPEYMNYLLIIIGVADLIMGVVLIGTIL